MSSAIYISFKVRKRAGPIEICSLGLVHVGSPVPAALDGRSDRRLGELVLDVIQREGDLLAVDRLDLEGVAGRIQNWDWQMVPETWSISSVLTA